MLYLVTGGSGSGKSEYAEELICNLCRKKGGGEKYYIATMIPYGEETKKKIARHRELRKEKAFLTKECFLDLKTFVQEEMLPKRRFVLLECMSNLVANELFEKDGAAQKMAFAETMQGAKTDCFVPGYFADSETANRVIDEIAEGVRLLTESCEDVVVVTNEVCSESAEDSSEMMLYKQVLAGANCQLAKTAAQVTEVVYGHPVTVAMHTIDSEIQKTREWMEVKSMRLIIGGAFQGKLSYAKEHYPGLTWVDGATCELDEIMHCEGMYHFETYIKRRMQAQTEETIVQEILTSNPGIVLVSREIGYGLVPVDAFERSYREQTGRICTELAKYAQSVERVVCGIPMKLK